MVLAPEDLEPIIAGASADEIPTHLFAFLKKRFPFPERPLEIAWGDRDAMIVNGTGLMYTIETDEAGAIQTIGFHPALREFPQRLAGAVIAATTEYFIRTEQLAENVPVGTFEVLPLFFGLGPVMANAALHEFAEGGAGVENWDMNRVGRVSSLEFGYTMALADWALGTGYHEVAGSMRPDAKETLLQGLRFLEKSGNCYFEQNVFDFASKDSVSTGAARLRSSNASRKLGTLHDLVAAKNVSPDLVDPITEQLNHREDEIQRLAAAALGHCESLAQPVHDELLMMAEDAPVAIRRAAVSSLRPGFDNDDCVLDTLSQLLRKADAASATVCIRTLLKYNNYPDGMIDSLMRGLSCMVLTLQAAELQPGVELLRKLTDDPKAALHQHFEGDPTALAIFDELLESTDDNEGGTEAEK